MLLILVGQHEYMKNCDHSDFSASIYTALSYGTKLQLCNHISAQESCGK